MQTSNSTAQTVQTVQQETTQAPTQAPSQAKAQLKLQSEPQSKAQPSAVTIDILIPVYNVAPYIDECLASILAQIDDRAKVRVMNDASTDNSPEVLEKYRDHPQVTLCEAPHNRGLSETRNQLFLLSDADYLWFIDSDDVMHQGAYQKIQQTLAKSPVDVVCGDYISWKPNKRTPKKAFLARPNVVYQNKDNAFLRNIVKNNSNHVWNKVYHRRLLTRVLQAQAQEKTQEQAQSQQDSDNAPQDSAQQGLFKQGLKFEDIYFMTDISPAVTNYLYCRYPLIDYRERDGSIVQTLNQKYVDDYLGAFIYRVDAWRHWYGDGAPFIDYLLYKTFNRYVALAQTLCDADCLALLAYTHQTYGEIFLTYRQQIGSHLNWVRRRKLKHKARKLAQHLSRLADAHTPH